MNCLLKIVNVGQGDCLILSPPKGCKHYGSDIFIDCGKGFVNPFNLFSNHNLDILITHGHNDHIGGIRRLSENNEQLTPRKFYIPFYFDEIVRIAKFILNLPNVDNFGTKSNYFNMLCEIRDYPNKISEICYNSGTIIGVGENTGFNCKHIEVMNPPLSPAAAIGVSERTLASYKRDFQKEKDGAVEELKEIYFNQIDRNQSKPLISFDVLSPKYREDFEIAFIMKNRRILSQFIENPKQNKFDSICDVLKLTSNDASIVFKYKNNGVSFLFTGDISKKVFRRLINNECDLKSDVIKVPHHGSKGSLSREIISHIRPEYAIICHNNRGGNSPDSHPHIEVIDWLEETGVKVIYTNDVRKRNPNYVRSRPFDRTKFGYGSMIYLDELNS